MDDFITLDFLEDTGPAFDLPPPGTPSPPDGPAEFMRMVANGDSADGYFGGYCVVA
ncbi:mating pheromone precursor bbp2-4 [Schizophyllum fasciatum]